MSVGFAPRQMRGRGIALAFFGLVVAYGVYDCLRSKVSSFAYVASIKNYQAGGGHDHCRIDVQLPVEILDRKPSGADESRLLRNATRVEITLSGTCKDAVHTWVPARFREDDREHVELDVTESLDTTGIVIVLLLGTWLLVAGGVPQIRKLAARQSARRSRREADQRVSQARVVNDRHEDV